MRQTPKARDVAHQDFNRKWRHQQISFKYRSDPSPMITAFVLHLINHLLRRHVTSSLPRNTTSRYHVVHEANCKPALSFFPKSAPCLFAFFGVGLLSESASVQKSVKGFAM